MGLDMYLTGKRRLVGWDSSPEADELQAKIAPFIGGLKAETITFEAAYWRKANAIHYWFVKNVQGGRDDCNEYELTRDSLKELVAVCKEVLGNIEKAGELLPPCPGFFFGSSDIDSYYFDQLRYTVEELSSILNNESLKNVTYTYQSSW